MFARVVKAGFLAALVVAAAASPAEAFGRRHASSNCCVPASYCPAPCPPCWPPMPTCWDCVCNATNVPLRITIVLNLDGSYGPFVLQPGQCLYFPWRAPTTTAHCVAFDLLGNKVADLDFPLLCFGPPCHGHNDPCMPITGSVKAVQTTSGRSGK